MESRPRKQVNVNMQIWLGKQLLGQKNHAVQENSGSVGLQLIHIVPQPQRDERT
jgi:hypothetical protein